jgi:uncharacterized protein YhbP (UPF0306 family)
MEIPTLVKKYLSEAKVMQLATAAGNRPWACNVHFVADDKFNLYWLSMPSRRHSQEIANNKNVAITIAVRYPDKPVVGLSAEGQARVVDRGSAKEAIALYDEVFSLSDDFKSAYFNGTELHELYKLTPLAFVLFDEVNFPKEPRTEWRL